MNWIGHLLNEITFFRIIVTVFLLVMKPFSMLFWILYISAGVSDIADGFLARKMHLESESGAKLDSAADLLGFLSSAEELYSIIKSSELKRDCRGLFDI